MGLSKATFAQTTEEEAEVLYENAEKAYDSKDYAACEIALVKCIQMLGSTNPKIDYLRIRNLDDEVTDDVSKVTLDNYTLLQNAIADFFQKVNKSTYPEEKYKQIIAIKLAIPDLLSHYQQLQDLIKNFSMVYVEGGSFKVGSMNAVNGYTMQEHRVTLSSFYIGKYDVTQAQWKAVMGNNPSNFQNCDDCPVEQVSWNDVQGFIQKLNQETGKHYRLPTEAEWEYAAAGGNKSNGYTYSGSNDINSVAWYKDNSGNKTHPVGQKQANELGIYDMNGNVWQWCQDWFSADYYSKQPTENQQGPPSGSLRVYRGGSWDLAARHCRVTGRWGVDPSSRLNYLGFRLALAN